MYKRNLKYSNKDKGQALLFIIVIMTITLAVGIALATRTVSSLRRTSSTDTATKVLATSEGVIEYFLQLPISELREMADDLVPDNEIDSSSCPTETTYDAAVKADGCIVGYNATGEIPTRALVRVEYYNFNFIDNSDPLNNHLKFTLEGGDVREVRLTQLNGDPYPGDGLEVCWKSKNSDPTGIYYVLYNEDQSEVKKEIVLPESPNPIDQNVTENKGVSQEYASASADTKGGFTDCYEIDFDGEDYQGLRMKSLYGTSDIGIYPDPDDPSNFPVQGFLITSTGELLDNDVITTTRSALRSFPFMPSIIDYVGYSNGALE